MITVFQFTANLMFQVLELEPIPFSCGQMAILMFVSIGYVRKEFPVQRLSPHQVGADSVQMIHVLPASSTYLQNLPFVPSRRVIQVPPHQQVFHPGIPLASVFQHLSFVEVVVADTYPSLPK